MMSLSCENKTEEMSYISKNIQEKIIIELGNVMKEK